MTFREMVMRTVRIVAIVVLSGFFVARLAAQSSSPQQQQAVLTETAKQGLPLKSDLTVKGNVTVQAVLIPAHVARRVFGKEIAQNYAVIELTVTNKSPDAALIIQGAYIDYTDWALSGSLQADLVCREVSGQDTMSQYQACTQTSQVASEEYRVARGELLDAQTWTARNTTVRLLTLLGSIASGYSFSIKQTGYNKGIAAFAGTVVPGVATFWPDPTVEQLNRISDFGFHTNKVIPKQGADIIVCFFPIDRFLTPGFKKLFLTSPSLFFSPYEMLTDSAIEQQLIDILPRDLLVSPDRLMKALPCYLRRVEQIRYANQSGAPKPPPVLAGQVLAGPSDNDLDKFCAGSTSPLQVKEVLALDTIGRVSLNTVRVVIDGIMTVESNAIAAKIESVVFDGEDTDPTIWTATGEKKGTINGSYLTGGSPQINEAASLKISDIASVISGSSDQALPFSLKLGQQLSAGQKLTFVVEKKQKDAKGSETTINSAAFTYTVSTAPIITGVTLKNKTITVKGKRMFNKTASELTISVQPPTGAATSVDTGKLTENSPIELSFDLAASPSDPGCWTVNLTVDKAPAAAGHNQFPVSPTPAIGSAQIDAVNKQITISGSQLIDTTSCGGPALSFQVLGPSAGASPQTITPTTLTEGSATFNLPDGVEKGWKVQVLLGGEVKGSEVLK